MVGMVALLRDVEAPVNTGRHGRPEHRSPPRLETVPLRPHVRGRWPDGHETLPRYRLETVPGHSPQANGRRTYMRALSKLMLIVVGSSVAAWIVGQQAGHYTMSDVLSATAR